MPILRPHAARYWQARDYGSSLHPGLYFRVGRRFVQKSTSVFGDGRISTHANLRPHAARYSANGASIYSSVTFTVGLHTVNLLLRRACNLYFSVANRFVGFWASGEAYSSPKWKINCSRRRWTTLQNFTPLALSSPEESATVQEHKIANKQ